jgi:hypothetical protein
MLAHEIEHVCRFAVTDSRDRDVIAGQYDRVKDFSSLRNGELEWLLVFID